MCGISGLIKYDNTRVNINILKSMTAIQKNRGPDDEGYLIQSNFGIGHCRLSIIDLESGKQPMSTRNKEHDKAIDNSRLLWYVLVLSIWLDKNKYVTID